jgi:hypothetical protein
VGLLAAGGVALYRLHALVTALPRHQPTPAEMLLSLFIVLITLSGAMTAVIGGDLFKPHSGPPRSRGQP